MPAETALLLHGEEQFLVDEEARRRLAEWRQDLVSDFGFEALDPGGLTAAKLRDALLQAPFLDPYRVIAVRGIPARRAAGLAAAITGLPDTTRLVLSVSGRLGAGDGLLKAVKAAGGAVREFPRLKGRAMTDWAADRARQLGLPPTLGALVVRSSPADLGVIFSELRKLAGYRDGGGSLDERSIQALLAGGREEEVFRLTDNLLPRPTAAAFRTYRELLAGGQAATPIAYRLARHVALVLEVHARKERGEALAEIQAAMAEHNFVIQKATETATGLDADRLEDALRRLLDYEWEVKSGQVDAEWGVEGVLASL